MPLFTVIDFIMHNNAYFDSDLCRLMIKRRSNSHCVKNQTIILTIVGGRCDYLLSMICFSAVMVMKMSLFLAVQVRVLVVFVGR